MDQVAAPPIPTLEQLRHVANHFPIIDGHTHNLILPTDSESIPFESITTEAQGRALRDTFKSLPHLRAARQLRQLYECGEDADWEDILGQRIEWLRSNPQELHKRCFEGVHALLVDDGLADPRKVYPFDSHDEYLQAPSKRIVRIETVAERIMQRLLRDAKDDDLGRPKFLPDVWTDFTDDFEREIQDAVREPDVAGFKTVVCYRTGLDVEPDYEVAARAVGHPFERYVKSAVRKRGYRIERKPLNDYIVLRAMEILSEKTSHPDSLAKPMQFHTGLGDNDVDLLEANPAYLQKLIEAYPRVPIVLLHASYPYTKEAGYLTAMYRHVYLDVGEVFPMVSRDGQLSMLRETLQLAPGSKLLYSSDGHWFPESFYLAHLQFREAWLELLMDYVQKGDVTVFQAIAMTKDILFNNANNLYDLRHQAIFDETIREAPKQLTFNAKPEAGSPYSSPSMPPIPPAGTTTQPSTSGPVDPRSGSPFVPPSFPPPPKVPQVYNNELFDEFMKEHVGVRFVYVQWLDIQGSICTRIVPIKEFTRMIHNGDRIVVSSSNIDSTRDVSDLYLEPDLRSLSRTHNKDPLPSASVFCYCRAESGTPLPSCPRTSLEALINNLQYTYSTTLLVGFEIAVTFLSRPSTTDKYQQDVYQPLESTSSIPPFLSEILLALDELNIELESFHATRTSEGQYIFHFIPQPPLLAVDSLIQSRQVITQIAATHSIRTSLDSHTSGTNSRSSSEPAKIHFSLHPSTYESNFVVGGVASHLPAICAFTLSSDPRSRNDPLTHKKPGHWTLSCLDTLANPYFALSAVLGAGILGLQAGGNTAMGMEGLHGVGTNMPRSANDALHALHSDAPLQQILGEGAISAVMSRGDRHEGGAHGQDLLAPQLYERDGRRETMGAQPNYDTRQSRESSAYRQPIPAQEGLADTQAGYENNRRRERSPYDTVTPAQIPPEYASRRSRESSTYRQPTPAQGGLASAQGAYGANQRREKSPYDTGMGARPEYDDLQSSEGSAHRLPTPAQGGLAGAQAGFEDSRGREHNPYDAAMGAQVAPEPDEREKRKKMEERERVEEAERRHEAAEKEKMERRQEAERRRDMESPQSVESLEPPERRVGFDDRHEDAHEK